MTRLRDPEEYREGIWSSVNVIESNAELFNAIPEKKDCWRPVAVELRRLLPDGNCLVPRVLPDATFHPLRESEAPEIPQGASWSAILAFRGAGLSLSTDGTAQLDELVDRDAEPIPLGEWLEQWIQHPDVTIRQLIKGAAGNEAAHLSSKEWDRESDLKAFRVIAGGHRISPMHVTIVALGLYVADRLRTLLDADR